MSFDDVKVFVAGTNFPSRSTAKGSADVWDEDHQTWRKQEHGNQHIGRNEWDTDEDEDDLEPPTTAGDTGR